MKKSKNIIKQIAIGIVTGFLNGLFASGGGCIVVPALEKFLKFEPKKSHATAVGIILIMSLVTTGVYIYNGFFDLRLWIFLSIGGVIGGMIGAKLLDKAPVHWLKLGFGALIIFAAVKMIF